MNKKLFLLPVLAMLLVGCGKTNSSAKQSESTPVSSSESEAPKEWTQVTPEAGKKYKLAEVVQSGTIYLTGVMDGNYMGGTTDIDEAADVELVAVTGGFNFKVTLPDGTTVKYINFNDGNYTSPALEDTAKSVFVIGDPDNTSETKRAFVEKTLVTTFQYKGEATKICVGTQTKFSNFAGTIEKYWDPTSNAAAMFMELK